MPLDGDIPPTGECRLRVNLRAFRNSKRQAREKDQVKPMTRHAASTGTRGGTIATVARAAATGLATLTALLTAVAAAAEGVTVHRWVDDQGVTHFSDTAPRTAVRSERWEVTVREAEPDPAAGYYSVANQWRRLSRERDAREARRLERRYLDAVTRARTAPSREPPHPSGAVAVPLGAFPALNVPRWRRPGWHGGGHRQPRPPVVQPAPAPSFHVAGPGREAQAARARRRAGAATSGAAERLGGGSQRKHHRNRGGSAVP